MTAFDPTEWNFIELKGLAHEGYPARYEYRNNPIVDGTHDFLRINLYLSRDGDYVTIFNGLLEPSYVAGMLADRNIEIPSADFNFSDAYNEDLFRGHIDSKETAECIFKAIGLKKFVHPNVLTGDANGGFACKLIGEDS